MLVKMFVERSPERNKSREGRKIIGGRVEIFPFAKNKIVASEIIFPTYSSREENDLSSGNEKKCSKGEKRVEVQSFFTTSVKFRRPIPCTYIIYDIRKGEIRFEKRDFRVKFKASPSLIRFLTYARGENRISSAEKRQTRWILCRAA